jgi:hypothetical protein
MGVGFAHQLVGLLGRGVERERMIDAILDPERQPVVAAIDRGGGSVDEVGDAAAAGEFDQIDVADQIGLDIGPRIFDRVAHPGLGAEVDDPVEAGAVQCPLERFVVREVRLDRGKGLAVVAAELGIPVALQGDAVIIVEIVDSCDLVAAAQETVGDVMADEAGGAGDEDLHWWFLLPEGR